MPVTLEELVIALADKLWKGVRKSELESLIIDRIAEVVGRDRWDIFIPLDSRFEEIASSGHERLERSRIG